MHISRQKTEADALRRRNLLAPLNQHLTLLHHTREAAWTEGYEKQCRWQVQQPVTQHVLCICFRSMHGCCFAMRLSNAITNAYVRHMRGDKTASFRVRDLNPGLSGESRVS